MDLKKMRVYYNNCHIPPSIEILYAMLRNAGHSYACIHSTGFCFLERCDDVCFPPFLLPPPSPMYGQLCMHTHKAVFFLPLFLFPSQLLFRLTPLVLLPANKRAGIKNGDSAAGNPALPRSACGTEQRSMDGVTFLRLLRRLP